jgi:TonB-dependent starch-binding outer membrane protein SusC
MTKFYLSFSRYVTVLLMLTTTMAWSQSRTVTGKVTASDDGSAMPGVNIVVKGTSTGTTSDVEGRYSVSVADNATLIFTFVGYATQEVSVGAQSEVNVTLQSDITALSEVVVEGYATIKKKDLTGSVSQVSAGELNKGIYTSPAQLLQGKIAGLLVVGASGAPGAETAIQIRGVSSLRSGTAPLIVVDGIQLDNQSGKQGFALPGGLGNAPGLDPFSFLNPNDIERVDVLKDASALAIYGSRGANGVIMITTKKAAEGVAKIDFSASAGVSSISKKIKVLNGNEYRDAMDKEGVASGDFGDNVDAFDKIIQTGSVQNYNVGLSVGNHGNSHRISVGYTDQKGIIKKSGMKKYNAMLKSNYSFLDDKIKVDVLLLGAHIEQQSAPIGNNSPTTGNLISQALQWNPTRPLYNIDGTLNQPSSNVEVNPMATLAAIDNNFEVNRIIASIAPTIRLAKGLDYKVQIALDHSSSDWNVTQKKFLFVNSAPGRGQADYSTNSLTTQQFSHTLSYTKDFSDFNLTALLGYEYQKNRLTGLVAGAVGFSSDDMDFTHNFQNALAADTYITSIAPPDSKLQSYFGRAQVNYKDRVRVTATVRSDGSSKFGKNNRTAVFPAFAVAWSLDKEGFVPESIDALKLRASWGQTGNQSFPSGLSSKSYVFGKGGGTNTIKQADYGSPDLRWETSETTNIGIDFGVFNSRITGSVDVYNKKTNDQLFNLPAAQPFTSVNFWKNLDQAVITNKGLEINLNSYVIDRDKLKFQIGANVSFRQTKFTPGAELHDVYIETGSLDGNGLTGVVGQRTADGQPINSWYMKQFQGFDENGISKYRTDPENPGKDKFYSGTPYPSMIAGITFSVTAGKFDATVAMNGVTGNKIYNNTANALFIKSNLGTRNITPDLVGNGESLGNSLSASTRYLENGNFLRLANLTMGYNFDFNSKAIKNVRLFATAQNLFVITKYKGFDPEVNTNKTVNGIPSFGVDYTQYPRARSFVLGLTASF